MNANRAVSVLFDNFYLGGIFLSKSPKFYYNMICRDGDPVSLNPFDAVLSHLGPPFTLCFVDYWRKKIMSSMVTPRASTTSKALFDGHIFGMLFPVNNRINVNTYAVCQLLL